MTTSNLLIELKDTIAWLSINRPEKLNALNLATIIELNTAIEQLKNNTQVRVIVLTGSGTKAFVAGADIAEMDTLSPIQARDFSKQGQQLMLAIERCGKPVIAMINGFALGGGLELAMACSIRIASRNAKMGQPEVNLGLIPGFGGTQRLVKYCGKAIALDLCLSGHLINAERALAINLITRMTEPESLLEETEKLATHLASLAPLAMQGVLDCIHFGAEAAIDVGLDYESQLFGLLFSTQDKQTGTKAFLTRQPAVFEGK
ncbi:MAG: enoyl-CoA hydratase/isomerase family protein [Arenimonas sp.]|nr:enoyl-CoA hydratase/isomerase family protein [Arenimonas sp.]